MLPFVWTVSSAFKSVPELYIFPPTWFPESPQPENFVRIWQVVPFAQWTFNSTMVVLFNIVAEVFAASAVAYGFSRFNFYGRNFLFVVLLSTMMLPIYVTIIPRFLIFRSLGWIDSLATLIVPPFFGGGAFYIFLLRQFFMTIPRDFDEAAFVDGASSFTIFWRIILPLSKPALSTVAIFSFLASWNNFIEPLIYLNTAMNFTLPLGLTWFRVVPMEQGEPRDHLLMAASVTFTLPAIILFFAAQRYFVRGIVMSGLKG
ncbi:MAG: carbohydrate ABC transporter permease [Caldilineaceae bacterium]|nr:carbohydrate ABC transporter permease [Caldilineaceae bacterium]